MVGADIAEAAGRRRIIARLAFANRASPTVFRTLVLAAGRRRERARELAHWQVAATEQTMRLEDQATGTTSEMEERLAEQLVERGGLWGRSAYE